VADTKISALTAVGTPALTDQFAVNQGGTSKRETLQQIHDAIDLLSAAAALADANSIAVVQSGVAKEAALTALVTYLQAAKGMPRVARLGSQHSVSSTTGTKVTGLDMTLEAGTYQYKYDLLIQQATSTSDAPQFGINFSTGTAAVKAHGLRFWDATTAITAAVHIMDNIGIKTAGFIDGMVSNAYTTTAPDMGTTIGVAATGVNIYCIIEGIIVVTVQGNLELWRAAEATNASTTEVGSSLTVIRTA
jgi:hypothetical protein